MKRIYRFSLGGVALVLILAILSCSSPAGLLATSTAVPSDTPTKTLPPPPTATPAPPVYLFGCTYADCPDAKSIDEYAGGAQAQPNIVSTIEIPWTDAVHLFHGWCATDKATLDANLRNINFLFMIDDVSYLGLLKGEYYDAPDTQDPNITEYCYGVGGVASGWKLGESHMVRIGVEITAAINDGWSDYPAGSSYPFLYMIVPSLLATETPLPAAANTLPPPTNTLPTATNTLAPAPPTAPPATSAPVAPTVGCEVNSNIRISNRSDGPATLYLTGPASFTFSLGLGENTVRVCAGTYNYYVEGTCNGSAASGTGKISDGDDIYFYCN